jgi:hypothetical protein
MGATLLFFAFLAVLVAGLWGLASEGGDWITRLSDWLERRRMGIK